MAAVIGGLSAGSLQTAAALTSTLAIVTDNSANSSALQLSTDKVLVQSQTSTTTNFILRNSLASTLIVGDTGSGTNNMFWGLNSNSSTLALQTFGDSNTGATSLPTSSTGTFFLASRSSSNPVYFDIRCIHATRGFYGHVASSTAASTSQQDNDYLLQCNATSNAITATLRNPTATGGFPQSYNATTACGNEVTLAKTDSTTNIVTMAPNAGATPPLTKLAAQYQTATYITDGINWNVKSAFLPWVYPVVANNANVTVTLPPGAFVIGIVFFNTTANAVTGGIKVGTTSGAVDVVAAQAVGANALVYITDATLLKRIFSTSATQQLFIQAVTSWNSAVVNCYVMVTSVLM